MHYFAYFSNVVACIVHSLHEVSWMNTSTNSSKCLSGLVASSVAICCSGWLHQKLATEKKHKTGNNFCNSYFARFSCISHCAIWYLYVQYVQYMWLSQAQITSLLKHNKNTGSKGRLVQNLNFYSLSIPQLTESVVSILDDVSDWPEDVVQEHSSAYVFNHHLQYYFCGIHIEKYRYSHRIINIQQLIQLLPVHHD